MSRCVPIREVSSFQRVVYTYVQASIELGPEVVFLLERCPPFRGWYICAGFNGVGT